MSVNFGTSGGKAMPRSASRSIFAGLGTGQDGAIGTRAGMGEAAGGVG
jgi:hypothetical protein